jgi:sugar O-acyltransferase (sialic acid O-acetyltransferase NeuD family)
MISCVMLGAGGHARVLIDILQMTPAIHIHSAVTPDASLWGKSLHNIPILGGDVLLQSLLAEGVTHFVVGVGSTASTVLRQKLFQMGREHLLTPLSVIHPTAIISQQAQLGLGVQILAASLINTNAKLGDNVVVNSGAMIEHDCEISDHVHVATGAILAGGVHVGRGAHIGAGATIRQGLIIGEGSVVGMGAVVIRSVEAHTTVVGVPAHVLRSSNE